MRISHSPLTGSSVVQLLIGSKELGLSPAFLFKCAVVRVFIRLCFTASFMFLAFKICMHWLLVLNLKIPIV